MGRPRKDAATTPHSQTLDRGLRLLAAVVETSGSADVAMLAGRLDIHVSVVYRLMRTLEDHRFVHRTTDGRYEPGLGLAALAAGARRPVQDAALPELTRLAGEVGETAFLAVRDGDEAVTLATVEPPHGPAHVVYRPGTRHPVVMGAPGLALLAGDAPIADERTEVTETRRRGYGMSAGEVLPGLSSVASPVVTGSGRVAGAIALVFLRNDHDIDRLGELVATAARRVAVKLT